MAVLLRVDAIGTSRYSSRSIPWNQSDRADGSGAHGPHPEEAALLMATGAISLAAVPRLHGDRLFETPLRGFSGW